jgi:DNA-binding NarL/FixJ family response regulator
MSPSVVFTKTIILPWPDVLNQIKWYNGIALKEIEVSPDKRIRILIADDQAHVRKGLQVMLQLEEDLEVVGSAANGVEAVKLAERLSPDVILMDLSMPHLDGFEATQRISDKGLPCLVIALAIHRDQAEWKKAEQAGAVALIEKGTPDTGLIQVIRSAYQAGSSTSKEERR